jgi:hypothetical protein
MPDTFFGRFLGIVSVLDTESCRLLLEELNRLADLEEEWHKRVLAHPGSFVTGTMESYQALSDVFRLMTDFMVEQDRGW